MNNDVVFAAAGNGKTYSICHETINLAKKTDKHILLVTYTHEGVRSLEKEYKKQNYGVLDKNVVIKTWYSFLLSELIKPYQCLLQLKRKYYNSEYAFSVPENFIKSIAFYQDEELPKWYNSNHIQYFINSAKDIRKDQVGHLAICCIDHSKARVIRRMEAIYSHIYFDELQDYAGWDLEILMRLFASSIAIKCVGDYKQATFRTNNSQKYRQYRDDKIIDFFILQNKKGICNLSYDNSTRRFNHEICDFVNNIYGDKNSCVCQCDNYKDDEKNTGVFIIDNDLIEKYCNYYSPIILRYQCDSKIGFNHNCQIYNYGNSKGATFERVVIVPVGTVLPFLKEQKSISSNQTRSKFYVACTRAKHSLVFAMNNPKKICCFKPTQIELGDEIIPAYKYMSQSNTEQ